jgi:hypothetical protein
LIALRFLDQSGRPQCCTWLKPPPQADLASLVTILISEADLFRQYFLHTFQHGLQSFLSLGPLPRQIGETLARKGPIDEVRPQSFLHSRMPAGVHNVQAGEIEPKGKALEEAQAFAMEVRPFARSSKKQVVCWPRFLGVWGRMNSPGRSGWDVAQRSALYS